MRKEKVFFLFIYVSLLSLFCSCDGRLMNMKGFLSGAEFNEIFNGEELSPMCFDGSFSPPCMAFCHEFPAEEQCVGKIDYCTFYPDSVECLASCLLTPFDPTCPSTPNCSLDTNHPACVLYCSFYPSDPICATVPDSGVYVEAYDSYTQTENLNRVDMIWIMDNSSSMDDEQDALASNFSSFIDEFSQNGVDFKMGITTTDTTGTGGVFLHDGEFQGAVPVLDSSMDPDFIKSNFETNIRVGITGSFTERGLLAAELAVQKNTDPLSNNFNFLRADAFLAIIVVSDENDISPDSTESYVNNILASKADPNQVAIYPIVDTTTPSLPDPYTSPIDMPLYLVTSPNPGGLRYMNASNATSGFSIDIHDNFANSIFEVGGGILSYINRYSISVVPALDSIEVRIDGVIVPHGEVDGWTFNFDNFSIYLHGVYIPPVGSLVEISYEYLE